MAPPRRYPVGLEPWTREGISEKKWRRRDLESRLTPNQLAARRAHTRATLKAAAEKRLAALTPEQRAARSAARAKTRRAPAIPKGVKRNTTLPGVNLYDRFHGKGSAMKGQRRPLRVMSTSERVGWLCAKAARRSLALRAALDAGQPKDRDDPPEWHTRRSERPVDAILRLKPDRTK